MTITVLSENCAGHYTQAEHGLSYLVEDDVKILFDTGQSDLFIRNAEILNIDLNNIETIVLSHGHFDHGNGLKYLDNKRLICHPGVFIKRYRKEDKAHKENIGLALSEDQINELFHLTTIKTPLLISNHVFFLGEIPRLNDFEAKTTDFITENDTDDFVTDDTGIAVRTPSGLVVITGCGHAGICNTIEHAKKITGEKNIYAVTGGFHLKGAGEQTKQVIEYFKKENIKHIHPSHCTDFIALAEFHNEFGINQIKTGDILNF